MPQLRSGEEHIPAEETIPTIVPSFLVCCVEKGGWLGRGENACGTTDRDASPCLGHARSKRVTLLSLGNMDSAVDRTHSQ